MDDFWDSLGYLNSAEQDHEAPDCVDQSTDNSDNDEPPLLTDRDSDQESAGDKNAKK